MQKLATQGLGCTVVDCAAQSEPTVKLLMLQRPGCSYGFQSQGDAMQQTMLHMHHDTNRNQWDDKAYIRGIFLTYIRDVLALQA